MKKIFAIGFTTTICLLALPCAFADEGETEAPVTVAPAIIQAPPAFEAPMAAQNASVPAVMAPKVAVSASTRVRGDTNLRSPEPEFIVGSVSCVVPSSLMRPRSKLVVSDQNGNETEFMMKTLAVIYDPTGYIMSLDKLQQGTKVQVHYKAACDNVKIATSVKVLK